MNDDEKRIITENPDFKVDDCDFSINPCCQLFAAEHRNISTNDDGHVIGNFCGPSLIGTCDLENPVKTIDDVSFTTAQRAGNSSNTSTRMVSQTDHHWTHTDMADNEKTSMEENFNLKEDDCDLSCDQRCELFAGDNIDAVYRNTLRNYVAPVNLSVSSLDGTCDLENPTETLIEHVSFNTDQEEGDDSKSFNQKVPSTDHHRMYSLDRPFTCELCGLSFSYQSNLTAHHRTHSGDILFNCDLCGKSFTKKSHLSNHHRTHSGDKPFSCDLCGKSFSQKSILTRHQRTHSGDRPFSCELCGKSFTQKIDLCRHNRTHSGDKPFSCDLCEKSFTQKSQLSIHHRMHSGDKPFSCELCGKSFNQKIDLSRHHRTHSGDRPFSCDLCGKTYTVKVSLTRHHRTHHQTSSSS